MSEVTIDDILTARERIAPLAHRTPVMTCATIDGIAGRRVYFKCENFQRVGAFKFRGACNAVFQLPQDVANRGVATHSSGNHAQALALAARLRGIPAHIVMPRTAPAVKKRAVAGYGATIYECEPTLAARESTAAEVVARTGATLVHPFDNVQVIAGQGTCAAEFVEQVARGEVFPSKPGGAAASPPAALDAIIAPVGGGGLMSGAAIAARALNARTRVFGAEPAGADDAARSLATGRIIPQTKPDTIADGLLTSLSERTFGIISTHVERIFTVTDGEIIRAMRLVWERMKIVIEPSSAVPLAAILTDEFKANERIATIGVILSGGNVDLDQLPWTMRP
jgi:threonine dehydratase